MQTRWRSVGWRSGAAVGLALTAACFSGEGTIGALCHRDADCGVDQACENSVCGRCGDGSAQAGEVCLREGATIALGSAAPIVAGRDVDRDGVLDLITLRPGDAEIFVLRGQAGGFAAPERVALLSAATHLAVGDVDGDGTADAVVADEAAIALGVGSGTLVFSFGSQVVDWVAASGLAVAPAGEGEAAPFVVATRTEGDETHIGSMRVGQDGALRIEAERSLPGAARILTTGALVDGGAAEVIVDADGALVVLDGAMLVETARLPVVVPVTVARIVDGDGDGRPDLMVGDEAGAVSVWIGEGDGAFVAEPWLSLAAAPAALGFVDLNRDGQRDVVAATVDGTRLVLANGPRFVSPVALPGPRAPSGLHVAELTADVLPEIVVIAAATATVLEADP